MNYADEFPLLSGLGLYAADIRGDGNCLFNALSDQIYGDQNQHKDVRARVISYMREHADYYKSFIDVHPGGGTRRNPKRKNAGSYSTPTNFTPPTPAEIDRAFDAHLETMAKGGTYGDNMEITAFCAAFDVDVKIYQKDFAYMVSGLDQTASRDVAHIAYHTWEHYSSIRNLDGPHSGQPHVQEKALSPEEERKLRQTAEAQTFVLPWMMDVVSSSLPFLADRRTIKQALEDCKGNVDAAVSKLLDAEDRGSVTSAQESSSVERDADSDDDAMNGPNKRRDRRVSRATRSVMKEKQDHRRFLASQLAANDGSQESISSSPSRDPALVPLPDSRNVSDDDWQPSDIKEEDSISESSQKPPTRLKLNPPKPPTSAGRPPGKTQQRQAGPQSRRRTGRPPTARDRKDMKKQAQKAARKLRAQADAGDQQAQAKLEGKDLPLLPKDRKSSPGINMGFRTLHI